MAFRARSLLSRPLAVSLQAPVQRRAFSATMADAYIKRTTLFKIPKEEDIEAVLRQYEIVRATARKDGQPYIVSNAATKIINTDSPRSEGFTLSSQSVFKNQEDHEYYDEHDPAHQELKKLTAKVRTGVMTVVTEGDWPELRL